MNPPNKTNRDARIEAARANLSDISDGSAGRLLHVLIVDPETEFRRAIVEHVQELGHIATAFSNCSDAWNVLQSVSFDVMIIDLETPAVSALELARRSQKLQAAPVLIATSHNLTPKKRMGRHLAKANGFYQIICKSMSQRSFLNDVKVSVMSVERMGTPRGQLRLVSEASRKSDAGPPLAS
jgi:CheY-like chemotaxis protein